MALLRIGSILTNIFHEKKSRTAAAKRIIQPRPEPAGLEITTRIGCRNLCDYCPQETLIKAYRCRSAEMILSLAAFRAVVNKLPPHVRIHFSGMCEPWLNPDCTEMVLHAHSQGRKIRVFTTLAGMRPKDVSRLRAVAFDVFWVHLTSGSGLQNMSVDENYLHVLKMLHERKIPTDYVYYGDALHPEIAAILNNEARKETLCSRAGNLKHIGPPGNFPRRRGRIGCLRQLRQNVLLPNGDVVLCCMDYGVKHRLGNLMIDAYADLFESHEFQRVKTGMENPTIDILCRTCDFFAFEKEK